MNIILFAITGFGNIVIEELMHHNLIPKKIITRKEVGADPYLNSTDMLKLAEKLNIPVEVDKTYDQGTYDLCIVASYHKLINIKKSNFCNAYNMHPSLLPKFKGRDPISEVIKKKENFSGVTVHKLTEKFDEGEIFFQEKFEIKNKNKKEIMKLMIPLYRTLTKKLIQKFI